MSIDTTSDYHMHTRYSDGSGKINEMARAAVAAGLRQITITDHMPLPFATYYAMEHEQIHSYRCEIAATQNQFDGQLKIGMGLEAEYISEFRPWIKKISEMGWDQLLCSIHHLPGGGKLHLVNGSLEEFTRLIEHHDNDGEKLCRNYYQTLQEGFSTGLFQISGHLDIIKKFNAKNIFFDESSSWYSNLIIETLEILKEQGMVLEVNTGGFKHPTQQPYPSKWIILEALKRKIPIVLSSDSHTPETLGRYFTQVKEEIER